jgi:branched-chain amino acid transport system ATP-binding protein
MKTTLPTDLKTDSKIVLSVQNLRQNYGGVQALRGISFELNAGECVALIGPNGAGKSTCFACLAGQQHAVAGHVVWRGHDLQQVPVDQRTRMGVARTFQVAQVFEALTVLQNLQLVLQASHGVSMRDLLDNCRFDDAMHWIELAGLSDLGEELLRSPAAKLSYGAKKRLELAMAMAGLPHPSEGLMLLDEPAAGLSPEERSDMMARVKRMTDMGTTVLYTEHNMDAVFGVADRVLVLIDGQLVAQGTAREVAANELVRQRYLGQAFAFNQGVGHA